MPKKNHRIKNHESNEGIIPQWLEAEEVTRQGFYLMMHKKDNLPQAYSVYVFRYITSLYFDTVYQGPKFYEDNPHYKRSVICKKNEEYLFYGPIQIPVIKKKI